MGAINYVETNGTEYLPSPAADLITRGTSEMNCARECFETAGCSIFFFNNGCNILIGRAAANPLPSKTTTTAGELSNFCPTNPFVGSFTKQSSFYCKFLTTLKADDLIKSILEINNVDSAVVKLGEWMIEKSSKNEIFKATSTKVSLSSGNSNAASILNRILSQFQIADHSQRVARVTRKFLKNKPSYVKFSSVANTVIQEKFGKFSTYA